MNLEIHLTHSDRLFTPGTELLICEPPLTSAPWATKFWRRNYNVGSPKASLPDTEGTYSVDMFFLSLLNVMLRLLALISLTAAKSTPTPVPDIVLVTQVHLAQGITSASMTVSWVTPTVSRFSPSSISKKSEVRFSTNPSDLSKYSSGYSTSYTFNYMKLQNYTSGQLHHTVLENLSPSTRYYYMCGDFSTQSHRDVSGKQVGMFRMFWNKN